jgi:hypothetical protein
MAGPEKKRDGAEEKGLKRESETMSRVERSAEIFGISRSLMQECLLRAALMGGRGIGNGTGSSTVKFLLNDDCGSSDI